MKIYGFDYFRDTSGNFFKYPTILNPSKLPPLISKSELVSALSTAQNTQSTMQAAVLVNTAITVVFSGPLQAILESVK